MPRRLGPATALGLLLLLPVADAQIPLGADSIAVNVNENDFGEAGAPGDNCLVLDTDAVAAAGAAPHDLRLTACAGRSPGTEIDDGATQERAAGYPQANGAAAEAVRYADVNSNGRYDGGDVVYLTSATGAGTGLVRTTATGAWSVRVTGTPDTLGGHAAGTFVFPEDADCLAYCTTASDFGVASIGWYDDDNTGTYTPGDVAYLMPRAPGTPAGSLVPPYSVRLTAAAGEAPPSSTAQTTSTAGVTVTDAPSPTQGTSGDQPSPGEATPAPPGKGAPLPVGIALAAVAVAALARHGRLR